MGVADTVRRRVTREHEEGFECVATKDIRTVNTPSRGGTFCVGQYSKLLTKNTPPHKIRNINIIIIPRLKGGKITLNKNEFLVYNFFAWTVVVSLMYNYLCIFVRHFLVASFVMKLSLVNVVSTYIFNLLMSCFCQKNLFCGKLFDFE